MSPTKLVALALLCCLALNAPDAGAWNRGAVQHFATLPKGAANPEGITVGPGGEVYATGFAPTAPSGPGKVYVFDEEGRLSRVLEVAGSSPALLGLAFHPQTGALLVLDFGAGNVLDVDPYSGASSVFSAIGSGTGLNALAFDHAGNVYVSDSFKGVIWKIAPTGGVAEPWASDALLTTSGYPPFGANGLGFNHDESALFVANTGNDTIVRIPVSGGVAGAAAVFTNSINGADGLIVDSHDNLWVCANQSDTIVVVDPSGRVIAKLGDFDGVRHGSPVGLLFPASLARDGDWIYVTNLSLDLRPITGQQSIDSQWAEMVTRHTLSRLRARLPKPDRH
jgi:SMP-30/Gluconolactonase/LRE-like region